MTEGSASSSIIIRAGHNRAGVGPVQKVIGETVCKKKRDNPKLFTEFGTKQNIPPRRNQVKLLPRFSGSESYTATENQMSDRSDTDKEYSLGFVLCSSVLYLRCNQKRPKFKYQNFLEAGTSEFSISDLIDNIDEEDLIIWQPGSIAAVITTIKASPGFLFCQTI